MQSAKKLNQKSQVIKKSAIPAIQQERKPLTLFPFLSYRAELVGLILLAFTLYINTFWGDYVLDDLMSVTGNKFVLKGFSGIKNIFTTDSFAGFVDSGNTLQGGRYRPLALMSFAIEIGMWGKNPHLSHLINILIWVFSTFLVFHLLRNYFFRNQPDVAFLATLIFIIHPIHTEVVANIKSRDELLSFFFLILSILFMFQYLREKKQNFKTYGFSLTAYFLALISKENGVTFVILLPLLLYCFSSNSIGKIVRLCWPYALVLFLFLIIRFSAIGVNTHANSIQLNNPFLHAATAAKFATIFYCLLYYLRLLFFPHPLTYDYGYNQIPLKGFDNLYVWVSIVIYSALLLYSLKNIKKKNVLSAGILFYLISIFLVSNMLVDIGALLGERFLFQPSFGFSIVAGFVLVTLVNKIKSQTFRIGTACVLTTGLLIPAGLTAIQRNKIWKSESSLFLHDVKISSNSAVANNAAGSALIALAKAEENPKTKKELLAQSIPYFLRASELFKDYPEAYSNAAIAFINLDKLEEAEAQIAQWKMIRPGSLNLHKMQETIAHEFYIRGVQESGNKNYTKAVDFYEKAIRYDSSNAQYWFDLGGTSCMISNFPRGIIALKKCLEIQPDFKAAQIGLEELRKQGLVN